MALELGKKINETTRILDWPRDVMKEGPVFKSNIGKIKYTDPFC